MTEATVTEEKYVNMRSVHWNTASKVRKHKKQPEEGKDQGGSPVPLWKEKKITRKERYTQNNYY